MKNLLKILLIGLITIIFRIIGQCLIPGGEQSILPPSWFVENGMLPLVFSIYGVFVYSLIAAMFLLIRNQLMGNNILQGLKYGFSCCAVWVIYLLEPLPHVVPIDRITYPLADGGALLVMGILLGLIFGKTKPIINEKVRSKNIVPLIIIPSCFTIGRLIQYLLFNIYSSFNSKRVETIAWCVLAGFVIACAMVWLNKYIIENDKIKRALILGCLLFGLDLTLFNFFMPLVFTADILDLIVRTIIDFTSVTVGCLTLSNQQLI